MKALIIAEKPSVAKDIAKALNVPPIAGAGHWENDQLVISNAVGHLVQLAAPQAIANLLPVIPEQFELEALPKTQAQLRKLVDLMGRKDVNVLINACDAGREGEEIFRLIAEYARTTKTIKRMWLQSMTLQSIRDAYRQHLRSDAEMRPLADAARKRGEADWLVGINVTRICSVIFGDMTTAGRVQTPTLMIVVAREEAIRSFIARQYFEVHTSISLTAGAYDAIWQCPVDKVRPREPAERIWDRAEADAVAARCKGKDPDRIDETTTPSRSAAPALFDLTTLQREANQRFGMSANNTLKIAQALYQTHKVLTYPRTDAKALPEDYVPTVTRTIEALATQGYAEAARRVLDNGWIKPTKRVFDNSKISDHFAIVPTGATPQSLTADEGKIYDLVARRLLAVFHPDAEYAVTVRTAWIGTDRFVARGRVLVAPGWQAVYQAAPEQKSKDVSAGETTAKLPALAAGESGKTASMKVVKGETKPPDRFNEATLLSAMEHAGKEVSDEQLRAAMAEKGLGTPATRAATIEKLLGEEYMTREKRILMPTAKAFKLKELLIRLKAELLLSPELTGDWEAKLKSIEVGQGKGSDFLDGIKSLTLDIVSRGLQMPPAATCSACGKPMIRRKGPNGLFWGCTGYPGCKAALPDDNGKPGAARAASSGTSHTIPSDITIGCSKCGKPMAQRKGPRGPFWSCTGYPDCKTTLPDDNGKPGASREASAGARSATSAGVTIPCPKCGKPLTRRKGQKGFFWGCSAYPDCNGTLPNDNGKPGVRTENVGGTATRAEVERLTVPVSPSPQPTRAEAACAEAPSAASAVAIAANSSAASAGQTTGGPIGSTCPGCREGTLTLRSAPRSGRPYAGCTAFPGCKYFLWMDQS